MKNRTATETYKEHVEQAHQHLKRITEGLGAHITRSDTTPGGSHKATVAWSNCGDLKHLCGLLEKAARFINNEGE